MDTVEWARHFKTLVVTSDGPVRVVTMNRPNEMNAADPIMHGELAQVWQLLAEDHECGAVILTGAGRAFSAGGDFPGMVATQNDRLMQESVFDETRRTVMGMVDLPQPLIAAVNGPAVGLGASLVTLCDLAVASEKSFLSDPHLSVGLVPADGAALLWPMMIGLSRAKHYVFSGERIPAALALELGLFTQVVPPTEVLSTASALAHRLCAMPVATLRETKRLMSAQTRNALVGVLDDALASEMVSVNSAEHKELTRRLIEKSNK